MRAWGIVAIVLAVWLLAGFITAVLFGQIVRLEEEDES